MKHYWILMLLAALVLGGCESKPEKKARFMARGDAYFEQENYDKARLEYQNVLQIDPKNVTAHFMLAQVNEKMENLRNAVNGYRYVTENDAEHVEARVRLGELFLRGELLDESRKLVEEALALRADNPDALAVRGALRIKSGNIVAAREDGEKALALAPGHVKATMLLSSLFLQERNFDAAVELLDRGLQHNPDNKAIRLVLADIHAGQQDIGKATDYLNEIIALDPDVLAHRARLASYYSKIDAQDKAEAVLRQAITDAPDNPNAKLALVDFIATTQAVDAAEKILKGYIADDPKAYKLRFELASLYVRNRNLADAKTVYQSIIEDDDLGKEGQQARSNLARVLISEKQTEPALALIEEVLSENPKHNDSLLLRGNLALVNRDALGAIADFRALMRDQPDSVWLMRSLARAHVMNDEVDLAIDIYKRALDVQPKEAQLHQEYAQLLLSQNRQREDAIQHLRRVVELEPDNRDALNALFRQLALNQDWTEADNVATQLKSILPNDGIGYFFAGLVHDAKGEKKDAIDDFEAALTVSPEALEPLSGIVRMHLAMEDADAAASRLVKAQRELPQSPVVRNLLGEVNVVRKDFDAARVAFENALSLDAQFVLGYRNLSKLHATLKDMPKAIDTLERGLEATHYDASLVFQLASLHEGNGNSASAIDQYEALLARDPQSIPAANNLAMLLITHRGDNASALDRAAELVEQLIGQENPAYLDTLGLVNYKQGRLDDAIAVFEQAIAVAPEAQLLRYRLGRALYDKGQFDQARQNLELALRGTPRYDGVADAQALLQQIDSATTMQ